MGNRSLLWKYTILTIILFIFAFLLVNAQYNNGALFDFSSGYMFILQKVFASAGHMLLALIVSMFVIYRSHKGLRHGVAENLPKRLAFSFIAAVATTFGYLSIYVVALEGHSEGLAILGTPLVFLYSLAWFVLLQIILHVVVALVLRKQNTLH